MKIISWNINGIRAVLRKNFFDFLITQKADIVCLQEIKIDDQKREDLKINIPGYRNYWHGAKRPGYSGTAILIKEEVGIINISNGLALEQYDIEGRVQTLELKEYYLLNVYFPNANQELSRLGYKQSFNDALLKYILKLEKNKPVIITGDFNVAHNEIDLARPVENEGNAGFTPEERTWFSKLLSHGYLDSFRLINSDRVQYSWWSFRTAAKTRNIGWRIDYFVVSIKLQNQLKKAYILDQVQGSDHAPIGLEL